jgi:hypothetical protein
MVMVGSDDEEAERKRQERERERLSHVDRLHGSAPRTTSSGFKDMRSGRRTGRVVQLPLRLHPRVKAIIDAIMAQHRPPSLVALFEEMLEAYLEKHGDIDQSRLPSDEELVRRIENERDKRDGE